MIYYNVSIGSFCWLADALFFDDDPPRTEEDKEKRKKEAFQETFKFFPRKFHIFEYTVICGCFYFVLISKLWLILV